MSSESGVGGESQKMTQDDKGGWVEGLENPKKNDIIYEQALISNSVRRMSSVRTTTAYCNPNINTRLYFTPILRVKIENLEYKRTTLKNVSNF